MYFLFLGQWLLSILKRFVTETGNFGEKQMEKPGLTNGPEAERSHFKAPPSAKIESRFSSYYLFHFAL